MKELESTNKTTFPCDIALELMKAFPGSEWGAENPEAWGVLNCSLFRWSSSSDSVEAFTRHKRWVPIGQCRKDPNFYPLQPLTTKNLSYDQALVLMKAYPMRVMGCAGSKYRWNQDNSTHEFRTIGGAWVSSNLETSLNKHSVQWHWLDSELEYVECPFEEATQVRIGGEVFEVETHSENKVQFKLVGTKWYLYYEQVQEALKAKFYKPKPEPKPVEPIVATVEAVKNPLYTANVYQVALPDGIDSTKPFSVTFTQPSVESDKGVKS